MLGPHDHVPEPRPGRDVDLDGVEPFRLVLGEELLVRGEARLRLGMARRRAHPDPLELALERAPPRDALLLLDAEARLLLLEPGRVVALEGDALPPVEARGSSPRRCRGSSDRGSPRSRCPCRPRGAARARPPTRRQVVGRLVEQEQVGRREEQAAERDAPPLAAREGRHVAVALGQAERVHRAVEVLVEAPGVGAVDPVLHVRLLGEQRVEVRIGLGEGRGDRVEAVEQVAHLTDAVLDVAADVLRLVELRLLAEEPDRRLRVELGDSRRRLLEAGHDPEQRRLAGPVRAEDADLRAVEERERDVGEDLPPLGAVELVGPVHRVDDVAHVLPAKRESAEVESRRLDPGLGQGTSLKAAA